MRGFHCTTASNTPIRLHSFLIETKRNMPRINTLGFAQPPQPNLQGAEVRSRDLSANSTNFGEFFQKINKSLRSLRLRGESPSIHPYSLFCRNERNYAKNHSAIQHQVDHQQIPQSHLRLLRNDKQKRVPFFVFKNNKISVPFVNSVVNILRDLCGFCTLYRVAVFAPCIGSRFLHPERGASS